MADVTTPSARGASSPLIEPAPPVRDRSARPEKRPEIKLSAAKTESRFVGPLPLAIGLIGLAAVLGFAHSIRSRTDDRNFVRAKDSLFQYESGLTETEKNYDAPVYAEALALLAKVDPDSISAEKAELLAADIKAKTDLFHRRIAARAQEELAIQNARAERDKEYLEIRQKNLLMPRKEYPECKEGEGAHAH